MFMPHRGLGLKNFCGALCMLQIPLFPKILPTHTCKSLITVEKYAALYMCMCCKYMYNRILTTLVDIFILRELCVTQKNCSNLLYDI